MPWGAVAGAVIGGVMSSKASSRASRAQGEAADRAGQIEQQMYGETKEQLLPYIQGGAGAFEQQQALSGAAGAEAQQAAFANYQESPGVAWQREQGMRGLGQNLARAGVGGGTRLRAISEYNQNLAMQDFSNQFNRLGSVTGVGLNAARALTGAGAASAAGQAQTAMAGGAAQASGIMGRANAFSSGVQSLGNLYTANKMGMFD